jgi:hypothetical protein
MSNVPFGLPDNDNSNVTLSVADEAGNPTGSVIDPGSLTVTSSDPASVTVTVNADGVSFDAKADGPLDAAVVVTASVTVGGAPFSGTETFDVAASAPTQLILTPGAPTANA